MRILKLAAWSGAIPFLLAIALMASPSKPTISAWSSPPSPRDAAHKYPSSVAGDRAVLVALYNATNGANWTNNTN